MVSILELLPSIMFLIVFLFAEKDFVGRIFFPSPSLCGVFRVEKLFSTKLFSAKSIQTIFLTIKKDAV
jgi:hypothetical protein